MTDQFVQLEERIRRNSAFAVVTHKRPDGDAIGSSLAFGSYLKSMGKEFRIYCVDGVPPSLRFLPGSESVMREIDDFFSSADSLVLIDCGDLGMPGIERRNFQGRDILAIDHHTSNSGCGGMNIIQKDSSATAEILYNYFLSVSFPISKDSATNLFCGLYTDTDAFTNLATTPQSLKAASELLALGADFKDITAYTMRNKSMASLKLWGRALERLRFDSKKGIAITVIKHSDFDECAAVVDDAEGVANLLNHLSDVKMSIVLRELGDGTVKGSLRTTSDLIDVSKVAKLMGGGGHKKAAGFTVRGRIEEVLGGWKVVN